MQATCSDLQRLTRFLFRNPCQQFTHLRYDVARSLLTGGKVRDLLRKIGNARTYGLRPDHDIGLLRIR